MGYGSYSHEAHRALTEARVSVPTQRVFAQRECHPLMNPFGITARESRDSADHPESLVITFALDVTGSMGEISETQVLFLATGDAVGDRARSASSNPRRS